MNALKSVARTQRVNNYVMPRGERRSSGELRTKGNTTLKSVTKGCEGTTEKKSSNYGTAPKDFHENWLTRKSREIAK